jgi:hypothetical protein
MQLFDDSAPEAPPPPRKERKLSLDSRQARRFGVVGILIGAIVIGLATSRAYFKPPMRPPVDMPDASHWLLTGHDVDNNAKLGLWAACWLNQTQTADHCRITNQNGLAQYDGDMLPLNAHQPVVAAKDLRLAPIDPKTLWIRGVHGDIPVPILTLANGTKLVPVTDREGLQNRIARGDWRSGLRGTFHTLPPQ